MKAPSRMNEDEADVDRLSIMSARIRAGTTVATLRIKVALRAARRPR
jgi:hypothetical protein